MNGGGGTTLLILCCCCILLIVGISGGAYAAFGCDETTKTSCFCDVLDTDNFYCNASETCQKNGSDSTCVPLSSGTSGPLCSDSEFNASSCKATDPALIFSGDSTCSSDPCTKDECCIQPVEEDTAFVLGPNPCNPTTGIGPNCGDGGKCFPTSKEGENGNYECKCKPGYSDNNSSNSKSKTKCVPDFNWDIIRNKKYVTNESGSGSWHCADYYFMNKDTYPNMCLPCPDNKHSNAGKNDDIKKCTYRCKDSHFNAEGCPDGKQFDENGDCGNASCTEAKCCPTTISSAGGDAGYALDDIPLLTTYETEQVKANFLEPGYTNVDLLDYLNNEFVNDVDKSGFSTKVKKSLSPGRYKISGGALICNVTNPLEKDITNGEFGLDDNKCLYNMDDICTNVQSEGSPCNASGTNLDSSDTTCLWTEGELVLNCDCRDNYSGSLCQIDEQELCNTNGHLNQDSKEKTKDKERVNDPNNLFGYRYSVVPGASAAESNSSNTLKIKPNYNSSLYYLDINNTGKLTESNSSNTLPSIYTKDTPCICGEDTHTDRKGLDYIEYKMDSDTLCNCPKFDGDNEDNTSSTSGSQGALWKHFYHPKKNPVNNNNSIDNQICHMDCPTRDFTKGVDQEGSGDNGYKTGMYYSYSSGGKPECKHCDNKLKPGTNGIDIQKYYGGGDGDGDGDGTGAGAGNGYFIDEDLFSDKKSFDDMFQDYSTNLRATCKPAYPKYYGTLGKRIKNESTKTLQWNQASEKQELRIFKKYEDMCPKTAISTPPVFLPPESDDIEESCYKNCKDDKVCTAFEIVKYSIGKLDKDLNNFVGCRNISPITSPYVHCTNTETDKGHPRDIYIQTTDSGGETIYQGESGTGLSQAAPKPVQTNYIPRPDKIIKELKCSDENSLHWTPSSEFGVQPVSGKCVIIPPLPKTRSFPDKHQGTSDSRSAKNVKNTLSADTPLPFLDTQHAGGFHLNCGGATDDWYRGPNNTAGYSDNIYGEIYLQSDAGKCPTGSSPNCFKKALNISDQWCDGKKLDSTSSDAHSEGMYKSVQYYTNNTLKDYCANWYLFDPENKYKIHVPLQKQEDIDKAQVVTGQPAVSQGAGAKPDQPWGWNDDFHCGEGGEEIMSDCAWFNLGCEWHKCLPDGTCDPPPAPS